MIGVHHPKFTIHRTSFSSEHVIWRTSIKSNEIHVQIAMYKNIIIKLYNNRLLIIIECEKHLQLGFRLVL